MLATELKISEDSVRNILNLNLGLQKICSRWVPHSVMAAYKQARVESAQEMLKLNESHSLNDI